MTAERILTLHAQRRTHIAPYSPNWKVRFVQARTELTKVFNHTAKTIEHIGSTAIPHIKSKPIIDVLITVDCLQTVDAYTQAIAHLGYIAGGEFGLPEHRFFCKGTAKECKVHVHIFEVNHPSVPTYRMFRDYMIQHPNEAKKYEALKADLAQTHPHNRTAYTQGKHAYIQSILNK